MNEETNQRQNPRTRSRAAAIQAELNELLRTRDNPAPEAGRDASRRVRVILPPTDQSRGTMPPS